MGRDRGTEHSTRMIVWSASALDQVTLYRGTDAVIRANEGGRWDLSAAPARTLGGAGLRNVGGDPRPGCLPPLTALGVAGGEPEALPGATGP
ncbi:hypothetical protein NDU88_003358 [Pleurodeles waltl]|uniref:Uncharacterized protein n=1 Tax=Pleurodeles waltl TaxID=8319 RepID=A0AAV7MT78_PLEWA|nr:hypothetical protein NDU88_003358 [Pleurodeles waltl]